MTGFIEDGEGCTGYVDDGWEQRKIDIHFAVLHFKPSQCRELSIVHEEKRNTYMDNVFCNNGLENIAVVIRHTFDVVGIRVYLNVHVVIDRAERRCCGLAFAMRRYIELSLMADNGCDYFWVQ